MCRVVYLAESARCGLVRRFAGFRRLKELQNRSLDLKKLFPGATQIVAAVALYFPGRTNSDFSGSALERARFNNLSLTATIRSCAEESQVAEECKRLRSSATQAQRRQRRACLGADVHCRSKEAVGGETA